MLVLTRKLQEQIVIGDGIKVTILRVKGNTVRLGIEAPRNVRVVRSELPPEVEVKPEYEAEPLTFQCKLDRFAASSPTSRENSLPPSGGPAPLPRCPAPLAAFISNVAVHGT